MVPVCQKKGMVSERKRPRREVEERRGLAERYMWAVTRSEIRTCLPLRERPIQRTGEEEVERTESKEEVAEMRCQLWLRLKHLWL